MFYFPAAGVTGRAGAAGGEVFTNSAADQATVHIVTACTTIVGICRCAGQGVVVTVRTAGCAHLNQAGMRWGVGGMQALPGGAVAGHTIATTNRDTWQQARKHGGVTQITVTHMGHGDRQVRTCARIVTTHTWGRAAGDITKRDVISGQVNCQVLIGVTWQTVRRVRTQCNRIDNFLTRTAMTGATGSGTVGRNVVGGAFDLCPVRNLVTVATWLTRCIERQVARTFRDMVSPTGMQGIEASGVTGLTITRCALADRQAHQTTGVDVVTAVTAVVRAGRNTDQGVIVTTGTARCTNSDDTAVIRSNRVDDCPGAGVTGRTVTTGGEVLSGSTADPATVGIVTAATCIVSIIRSADQGVVVAVSTAQGIHLDQGTVVRCACSVGHIPGAGMTGLAVTRCALTYRATDPCAGDAIVTTGTGVMRLRSGAHQGIVVTVATAGGAGDSHDTAVNWGA